MINLDLYILLANNKELLFLRQKTKTGSLTILSISPELFGLFQEFRVRNRKMMFLFLNQNIC